MFGDITDRGIMGDDILLSSTYLRAPAGDGEIEYTTEASNVGEYVNEEHSGS